MLVGKWLHDVECDDLNMGEGPWIEMGMISRKSSKPTLQNDLLYLKLVYCMCFFPDHDLGRSLVEMLGSRQDDECFWLG